MHQGFSHQVAQPAALASLSVSLGLDDHQPMLAPIPQHMTTYEPQTTAGDMTREWQPLAMGMPRLGGDAGWQVYASLGSLLGPGPATSAYWSENGMLDDARTSLAPHSLPQDVDGVSSLSPFNTFAEGSFATGGSNSAGNSIGESL